MLNFNRAAPPRVQKDKATRDTQNTINREKREALDADIAAAHRTIHGLGDQLAVKYKRSKTSMLEALHVGVAKLNRARKAPNPWHLFVRKFCREKNEGKL